MRLEMGKPVSSQMLQSGVNLDDKLTSLLYAEFRHLEDDLHEGVNQELIRGIRQPLFFEMSERSRDWI